MFIINRRDNRKLFEKLKIKLKKVSGNEPGTIKEIIPDDRKQNKNSSYIYEKKGVVVPEANISFDSLQEKAGNKKIRKIAELNAKVINIRNGSAKAPGLPIVAFVRSSQKVSSTNQSNDTKSAVSPYAIAPHPPSNPKSDVHCGVLRKPQIIHFSHKSATPYVNKLESRPQPSTHSKINKKIFQCVQNSIEKGNTHTEAKKISGPITIIQTPLVTTYNNYNNYNINNVSINPSLSTPDKKIPYHSNQNSVSETKPPTVSPAECVKGTQFRRRKYNHSKAASKCEEKKNLSFAN